MVEGEDEDDDEVRGELGDGGNATPSTSTTMSRTEMTCATSWRDDGMRLCAVFSLALCRCAEE